MSKEKGGPANTLSVERELGREEGYAQAQALYGNDAALREALGQAETDLRFLGKVLSNSEDKQIRDVGMLAASFADRAKQALAAALQGRRAQANQRGGPHDS
jgi:hypothetical protein